MKFIHIVEMFYHLSKSPNGLTAGAINKKMGTGYSKAQVDRQLKKLVGEGVLHLESSPHRANITKNVYHLAQEAVEDLAQIVECFDTTPHALSFARYMVENGDDGELDSIHRPIHSGGIPE